MAYPELANAPAECANSSWIFDALEVHVPYGGYDLGFTQPPLGSGIEDFVQNPNNFGFDKPQEHTLRERIDQIVEEARHTTRLPEEVIRLSGEIQELTRAVASKYGYFEAYPLEVKPPPDPPGGRPIEYETRRPFPLSNEDWYVKSQVLHPDDLGWQMARGDARREIRENLLKAAALAWCLQYATNQMKSLNANQAEAKKHRPSQGGPTIGVDPSPRTGPWVGTGQPQSDTYIPPGWIPTPGGDGDIGVMPRPSTPGDGGSPGDVISPTPTPTTSSTRRRAGMKVAFGVAGVAAVGFLIYRAVQ